MEFYLRVTMRKERPATVKETNFKWEAVRL
jgi:hypothetical protein